MQSRSAAVIPAAASAIFAASAPMNEDVSSADAKCRDSTTVWSNVLLGIHAPRGNILAGACNPYRNPGAIRDHVLPQRSEQPWQRLLKKAERRNKVFLPDTERSRRYRRVSLLRGTMGNSSTIIEAIKQQLRRRGITYQALAKHLKVSEPTVKRDLARGNFTLARLDSICEILGVSIAELATSEPDRESLLSELTEAQERALV